MKILTVIFIKMLRRIFYAFFYKWKSLYYRHFYPILKLNGDFTQKFFYKWEYLYYRHFYPKLKLDANFILERYLISKNENFDEIATAYRELFPDKVQAKINEADLICEHIFDLLGSGPKKLSPEGSSYQPIEWHSDFKSWYRWDPWKFYRKIRYGHIKGVDVKVPWELSRFQYLNVLGQAYILTKDKKYSAEFINQINDWIKNNPVGFGVNWKCTMDVAIRAANWLVAMEYFSNKGIFSQDFLNEFYKSIYEHGKFICGHLEYSPQFNTNHYIANVVGLFFISVYCHFFKESKKWQDFALRELSKEIGKQVYPDGCCSEASTSYHRLVLEMLFFSELLAARAGIKFSNIYKDRLRKMFEFLLYSLKPNGMISQIGDNDSGRFLAFSKRPILDHKYLLNFAVIYYNDSKYKVSKFDFDEESFWIFGKEGKELYDNLPVRKEPITSKSFPNAGWFIVRHNDDYCFISCGPKGKKAESNHGHYDKLSFELMINGNDIIVDPGTYIYTAFPQERKKFRSAEYHNTIKFKEYEKNEISDSIFSLPDRVKIIDAGLIENNNEVNFHGKIQYYGITHKRRITLDKNTGDWKIIDVFSHSKPIRAILSFYLSPNIDYDQIENILKGQEGKIAYFEVKGYKLTIKKYYYSPEYGVRIRSNRLITHISKDGCQQTIITYIRRKM